MVIAQLVQAAVSEAHQTLNLLEMGSQQSRHQQLPESGPSEVTTEKLEKRKCWKFSNCHKYENETEETEVYRPYSSNLSLKFKESQESSNLLNLTKNRQKSDLAPLATEESTKSQSFDEQKEEKTTKIEPSMAAGTIVGNWKTESLKRPDDLQFSPKVPSGDESTPVNNINRSPIIHESTNSIYSDVSSLRNEGIAEYFLSEHSQDMLMQIIRCFPFPTPKNSPKMVKRRQSLASVQGEGCVTEPSSSSELATPMENTKKYLFKKHKNAVSNIFHRQRNQEKRNRNGSSTSENTMVSKNDDPVSLPATPTTTRPHAHSTTSAPGTCTPNGLTRGISVETISNGGVRKGALSTLCQSSTKTESSILADIFRIKDQSRVKKTTQILAGKKLKHWCSQLCVCVIKSSEVNESGNLKDKQLQEQMATVSRRLVSPVEPCSSNSPCCGEVVQSESLKQHIQNLRYLRSSDSQSFDSVLKNSLLKVSVDTMAITALPLDCWLKERLKNWVQLSGHYGTIVPATNQTLWKKIGDPVEARAYEKIMSDEALTGFTPKFYKEIQHKNDSFIEIQDLLADFPNMNTRTVIDVKIGTRTFLESEVTNMKKRNDLYKKMIEIDPNEPTEEENEEQAITKLRYMQFRERESTSESLGFRIEAAQLPGGILQKSFKKIKDRDQVLDTFRNVLGDRLEEVSKQFENRLRNMRNAVEKSTFFKTHEVVGSSLLFIFDEEKSGTWMIDFAKSNQVDENVNLNHRDTWDIGNHEDGYLVGLDNLIEIFAECHS